jgi:hypothetical protein
MKQIDISFSIKGNLKEGRMEFGGYTVLWWLEDSHVNYLKYLLILYSLVIVISTIWIIALMIWNLII